MLARGASSWQLPADSESEIKDSESLMSEGLSGLPLSDLVLVWQLPASDGDASLRWQSHLSQPECRHGSEAGHMMTQLKSSSNLKLRIFKVPTQSDSGL